jgi:hypothetical protein
VYGDRGTKIKGELPYLIPIIIFKLFVYFTKKGENSAQVFIHLVLQNNKKGEIVTFNNFFDFIIVQNIIEFNKFFFKI